MSEANTRLLLNGLKAYRQSLDRHLNGLQAEFASLQSRWHAFSAVFAGDAADEFKPGWARTTASFTEYMSRTQAIAKMLDERIEYLEEANRAIGLS